MEGCISLNEIGHFTYTRTLQCTPQRADDSIRYRPVQAVRIPDSNYQLTYLQGYTSQFSHWQAVSADAQYLDIDFRIFTNKASIERTPIRQRHTDTAHPNDNLAIRTD